MCDIPSEVLENQRLQIMQPLHLVLNSGVTGAQSPKVVDDLGLFVHLLLDELGSLLGVDAGVEHEGW